MRNHCRMNTSNIEMLFKTYFNFSKFERKCALSTRLQQVFADTKLLSLTLELQRRWQSYSIREYLAAFAKEIKLQEALAYGISSLKLLPSYHLSGFIKIYEKSLSFMFVFFISVFPTRQIYSRYYHHYLTLQWKEHQKTLHWLLIILADRPVLLFSSDRGKFS